MGYINGRVSTSLRNLSRKSWFFPATTNSASADLWGFCWTIFLSCVSGAIQKGRNAAKLIGLRCDKAYGQKQYIVMRNRQSCLCKWQPENADKCVINQSTRRLMDWGSRGKSGVNGLKRNNWLFETFLQYCHAVAHQRPMKFIELIQNLWAIVNRMHFVSLDLI